MSSSNHIFAPQPWSLTLGRWVPLADLKTSGTYRGLWETQTHWWSARTSFLLPGTRKRKQIETVSGSRWFPENTPTCTFAHASHLLWPLYLRHNSPLEWTLPLSRRVFSVDECMPKKFLRLKKGDKYSGRRQIVRYSSQRTLIKMNSKRPTPSHIITKMTKIIENSIFRIEILSSKRKTRVIYKGTPIRLSAEFSVETLQAGREWYDINYWKRKK